MARDSSGAKVAACHATENWVDWPNLIWLAAMGKEENKLCMKIGLQQRTIRTKWLKDQNRSRYFCFNFFSRCLLLKVWMTMHHKMSASALRTCWVKGTVCCKMIQILRCNQIKWEMPLIMFHLLFHHTFLLVLQDPDPHSTSVHRSEKLSKLMN